MKKLYRFTGSVATTFDAEDPTDQDMDDINSLPQVLTQLKPDDVLVRSMYLMNLLPMKKPMQGVRFADEALAQAAPMVRGKPVNLGHVAGKGGPYYGLDAMPVGRMFRGSVVDQPGVGPALKTSFYMLADDRGRAIARMVDGGIISENSPSLDHEDMRCSICGASDMDCPHVPLAQYDGQTCYALMSGVQNIFEAAMCADGQQNGTAYGMAAARDDEQTIDSLNFVATLSRSKARAGWEKWLERRDPWGSWLSRAELSAIGFHDYPVAADRSWDAAAEERKADTPEKRRAICACVDGDPSNLTSYKFPYCHAEPHEISPNGVRNALARLPNSGIGDKAAVKAVLERAMAKVQAHEGKKEPADKAA